MIRLKNLAALSAALMVCLPIFGQPDNVRALNARLLQLHGAIQSANASEAAQLRSQAAGVISERAAALTSLIRQDPGQALGLAFAQELRDEIAASIPGAANGLESHGTWQGISEHLIFDDPDRKTRRVEVRLRSGGETLEIHSSRGEPHCVSNDNLTASGVRVGNVVAAGSTTVTQAAVAAAGCAMQGAQNSAILLVQFPNISLPTTVTPQSVWDIFFATSGRSVDGYWRDSSYGKASASGNVFGPFTLDRVYSCDEYNAMRSAAIAAADAQVNFTSYTRVFVVFPNPGSCAWAGLGTLGCSTLTSADGSFQASSSWLLATYMNTRDNGVKIATHEGGHNLTLHHASSRDYGTEALGALTAAGTLDEYGDPFSTMGTWNLGHYGAPHKMRMGWLSTANVATVETNGSFTISPLASTAAGLQGLKVRRGTGNNAWLWVEYRQPVGSYDSTLAAGAFGGALIHYEDSTTSTKTHLIDFTPGSTSSDFGDATLAVGRTWTDPYSNLTLSVLSASASGLTVSVNYGSLPCTASQPTVTISPANPSVYAGSSVNYTVTVTNNDTAGCASSTFGFTSTLPSGWSGTVFSPTALALAPGQTGSVTMTKTVAAGTAVGTYAVDATAGDATHTRTATANLTVTTPPPVISATLSAPATVAVRSNIAITATVRNSSGQPLAGATVNFTMTRPGNGTVTHSAVTNSSGVAVWSYRAQQRGVYTVNARATSGASSATTNTVQFSAN